MNKLEKLYLKIFHRNLYRKMKREARQVEFYNQFIVRGSEELYFPFKDSYTFKHSGHSGDIVYSLPAIFAMANKFGSGKANIFLQLDAPSTYKNEKEHPNGEVMLPRKVFDMFVPLLVTQPDILSVDVFSGQAIDCDMDMFRDYPILFNRGNIITWQNIIYPVEIDLVTPWITVEANSVAKESIVVARSSRYRCKSIDYSFLSQYPSVYFVGLEPEFNELRKMITGVQWLETDDFAKLASVIAGAKLFIGNQSFPFSLAEALKVPRLLESYPECPNVIPTGGHVAIFCLQNRFEFLTRSFWDNLE